MAEVPIELLRAPVSMGARVTLTALWSFASPKDPEPFVWPSQRLLGETVGISDRSVRAHLQELVEVRIVRKDREGRWGYRLSRPEGDFQIVDRADRKETSGTTGGSKAPERKDASGSLSGSKAPDRKRASTKTGSTLPQNTPGTPQFGGDQTPRPPPGDQQGLDGILTHPEVEKPDDVKALHAWFEQELCQRKKRRSPQGLSPKRRRSIDALLVHIRSTLKCDRAEAIESQREHLGSRLAELDRMEPKVVQLIGGDTPWRTGWWDYWASNGSDPGPNAPEWTPEDARTEGVF